MLRNLRKNLDLLSWDEAGDIASSIYKILSSRRSYDWLKNEKWIQEIEKNYKLKRKSLEKVKRQLAQKISKNLTKKCAKNMNIELKSGICTKEECFIIHNYMNPWMLFDQHASHIKHPLKNYSIWYTRDHREWYESLIDEDILVSNLVTLFENEYRKELTNKQINEIARTEEPVSSVAYLVSPSRPNKASQPTPKRGAAEL